MSVHCRKKKFERWYRVSELLLSERAKEQDGKGLQGSKVLGEALRLRKEFGGK